MRILINLCCFQCVWLLVVLGPAEGRLGRGALALCASIAIQLFARTGVRLPRPLLVASAAGAGLVADSSLALVGFLSFPPPAGIGWGAPLWMGILWANFATTLNESLAWAGSRPFVAALAGGAGGAIAYLSGQQAGAISLGPRPGAVLVVAALWAVSLPGFALLAKRLRERGGAAGPPVPKGGAM